MPISQGIAVSKFEVHASSQSLGNCDSRGRGFTKGRFRYLLACMTGADKKQTNMQTDVYTRVKNKEV